MRVALGVFSSAANPPAIGLIRDYFPPNYRSTANAVYTTSVYFGGSLASLSVLLIENLGWREDYEIFGVVGITFGILLLTILKEP